MSNSDKPSGGQARSRRLRLIEQPEFLASAILNKSGNLIADVHNAALFLEGCPDLLTAFYVQFDEMQQCAVTDDDLHPVGDVDVALMQRWLETQGFKKIPENIVRAAILIVATQRRFNPLQEWLATLTWDKTPRLAKWLPWFLGTADDDYHQMVGSMFLRSMIARAVWPGCKADYMLVLEGQQRKLKSTVCEILSHGYFSDSLPDLAGDPVRISQHLRGKWLIEVSELHAFSRAEASRLKQFLSSAIENYTPKYGRSEVREPRTCVFIGTTNKATYLRDETGGSRFWPVRCGKIRLGDLKSHYNQLIAEAYWETTVEKRAWWPPPELEEKLIGPVQDSRYQGDAWEQPIANWDRQAIDVVDGQNYRMPLNPPFYLAQIADGALGIRPGLLRKAEEMRLAQTLEFMGWKRAKRTMHGVPWFPPEAM